MQIHIHKDGIAKIVWIVENRLLKCSRQRAWRRTIMVRVLGRSGEGGKLSVISNCEIVILMLPPNSYFNLNNYDVIDFKVLFLKKLTYELFKLDNISIISHRSVTKE
jgi:hypothetical protein